MTASPVPIVRVHGTLLCVFLSEMTDVVAEAYQSQLLARIESTGVRDVLLDISAVDVVDTYVARVLLETANMAQLMGARSVLVGMRPDVAATLAHMGQVLSGLETALNVDDGFALLAKHKIRG